VEAFFSIHCMETCSSMGRPVACFPLISHRFNCPCFCFPSFFFLFIYFLFLYLNFTLLFHILVFIRCQRENKFNKKKSLITCFKRGKMVILMVWTILSLLRNTNPPISTLFEIEIIFPMQCLP
jgi:hypothetical protein